MHVQQPTRWQILPTPCESILQSRRASQVPYQYITEILCFWDTGQYKESIWQCLIKTAMSEIWQNKFKSQPPGNRICPMAEVRICVGPSWLTICSQADLLKPRTLRLLGRL